MANHMAEVAKILGVELGERFKICDEEINYPFDYYFSRIGLMVDKGNICLCADELLKDLLCGKYTIKRKPWKPKDGETYWCVATHGTVGPNKWRNVWMDIVYYKLGNCYRTEEEAEANKDKWIKFYASDEVLEV